MACRPMRFVTFLAPNLLPFYAALARHVSARLHRPVEIVVGTSYQMLTTTADVAFVCSLAYLEVADQREGILQPVAAPVLRGRRYGGRPIYFSDVVVRRDSPYQSFGDLAGCRWCYNEPLSQSGYGIVRFHLAREGQSFDYFGRVVASGYHARSLQLVAQGLADASAIDSHVLEVLGRDRPALVRQLRVIASLGPSTSQPVVIARRLGPTLAADLQEAFCSWHKHPDAEPWREFALLDRYVPVQDQDYQDIRDMRDRAKTAKSCSSKSRHPSALAPCRS